MQRQSLLLVTIAGLLQQPATVRCLPGARSLKLVCIFSGNKTVELLAQLSVWLNQAESAAAVEFIFSTTSQIAFEYVSCRCLYLFLAVSYFSIDDMSIITTVSLVCVHHMC